jgi:hypothetical protein
VQRISWLAIIIGGATETSTNYTATEASRWLGERPSTLATRLALWWQSSPVLCHLCMNTNIHPIGIHRQERYLISLFEKLLLGNVICDTPHHLQTMKMNCKNTAVVFNSRQNMMLNHQQKKTMMISCEQNKAALTDTENC